MPLSLALWLACAPPEVAPPPPLPALEIEEPGWPERSRLSLLAPLSRSPSRRVRLLVDAGHGSQGNPGNIGVRCQSEADEMKRITDAVVEQLDSRAIDALTTRPSSALVSYDARLQKANLWSDLMISLHSDVRELYKVTTHDQTGCRSVDEAHGFTVLWSDEGSAALTRRRHDLAVIVAEKLSAAGFTPFEAGYGELYDADPLVPGVYVDRHEPKQRIRLLRRPTVPSIIIETHNALDIDEVDRWSEPSTIDAFASALRAAVVAFYER